MRKIKILSISLLTLILLLNLTGCTKEQAVVKENQISVKTSKIEAKSLINQTKLAGTIYANQEVMISTKIPGKIKNINVKVGDTVEANQVLFELENKDLRAQVQQAEQNLKAAQANLANIKNGARPQEIEQINQAVEQAKIQLDIAQTNFDRMQELYRAEAISKQQYDQALAQLQLAEAAYKSALEKQSLVVEGASEDTIRAAEAQVGLAQANLAMAEAKLADTIITSPISGRIGSINIDAGEFVMQGNPVIQLIDDQKMIIKLDVSEKIISNLQLKDQVEVDIPAITANKLTGEISKINLVADPKSKLYPIEVTIANNEGKIKSGMSANVLFNLEKKENIIAIPIDATFEEYGEYFVYKVVDGKAVKTKVTIGINDGKFLEITSGLNLNDLLIISGQDQVHNGDLVSEGGNAQ